LNFTGTGLMFATRFGSPFDDVSCWAAAKELMGASFFMRDLNDFAVYESGVVPWQAPVVRWRHFYQRTFDASFLLAMLLCWVAALRQVHRRGGFSERPSDHPELRMAAIWSAIGLGPIVWFYLHFHAISSRYVLDMAPGVAAAMVGCIFGLGHLLSKGGKMGMTKRIIFVVFFGGWWGWQMIHGHPSAAPTPVWSQHEVIATLASDHEVIPSLPGHYSLDGPLPGGQGIRRNGFGWNPENGQVEPLVVLFIREPRLLLLDVAPASEHEPEDSAYGLIRARIGLEMLEVISVETTEAGRRLTFAAPKRRRYQQGIQVAFLGFASSQEFLEHGFRFKLLRVDWSELPETVPLR
jgi:hypothetical protein